MTHTEKSSCCSPIGKRSGLYLSLAIALGIGLGLWAHPIVISTSEIKTSVVVDEKYLELAVRQLHRVFELDQPPQGS